MNEVKIQIKENDIGKRADLFLLKQLTSRATALKESAGIMTRTLCASLVPDVMTVNGKSVKKSYKFRIDDSIEIDLERVFEQIKAIASDSSDIQKIVPQKGPLDVVYESKNVLVINKPSGITVHPGVGNSSSTLANYVKQYLIEKEENDMNLKRAGIVHRLDKGVSGLIIFAKNRETQLDLQKQFEEHSVIKIYLAKVIKLQDTWFTKEMAGLLDDGKRFALKSVDLKALVDVSIRNNWKEWKCISGIIKRDPANRRRMKFVPDANLSKIISAKSGVNNLQKHLDGKSAISFIKIMDNEHLLIRIKTGRMHQIRATLRYLGLSIEGDALYTNGRENSDQIELKAVFVKFMEASEEIRVIL